LGSVNEGLIRCSGLLLSLDFSRAMALSLLNDGKVGRPFKLTESYIMFLAAICYLSSMPYRQFEDFTRTLNSLIPKLPSIDYSWIRRFIPLTKFISSLYCTRVITVNSIVFLREYIVGGRDAFRS
jgi:hypothetical protein